MKGGLALKNNQPIPVTANYDRKDCGVPKSWKSTQSSGFL